MASKPARKNGRRKSPWVRRLKLTVTFGLIVLFVGFIAFFGLFYSKYQEAQTAMTKLPDIMAQVGRGPSRIVSADGKVLFQISEENRIPLHLSEIPEHVQNAILAAEDKRFYEHNGVDAMGLLRASVSVFREGRLSQGGSTITMQLAKQLYSGSEKSFTRKLQDIAFATAMERELVNKKKILELYLNQVYFGMGAHGIGAAAKVYFNKPVDKLTISDAAILARCVRLPSRENPYRDLDRAIENRNVVLGIMREEKMITDAEYDKALAEKPKLNPNPPNTTAFYPAGIGRHFVQHVQDFLTDQNLGIDLKRGGYTVYTTLDSQLQKLAEETVRRVVRENRRQKVNDGAFVAIDKDGHILCEVGGVHPESEWNMVTKSTFQPGSSFKAVVFSTAFREGVLHSPYDFVSNAPIHRYDQWQKTTWSPQNASRKENAPGYSAKTAFALSVNRCAIHLSEAVTNERVIQTAYDVFGFRSQIHNVPSLALGVSEVTPLEMVEAYSVFTLAGDRVRPCPVTRIESEDGSLVQSFTPQRFDGVLDRSVCENMDELTHAVVTNGTAYQVLGTSMPDARGKTGTTSSAKDAWFCGYLDGITAVGWVGNPRIVAGKPTQLAMGDSVYGGTVTTYIWRDIMKVARERFGARVGLQAVDPPVAVPDAPKTQEEKPKEVKPDDKKTSDPDLTQDPDANPGDLGAPVETPTDPGTKPLQTDPKPEEKPTKGPERDPQKGPTPPPTSPDTPSEGDTVTVEICVDSGRLATPYCPETVMRTFPKGKAPRRKCRIHGIND